MKPNRQLLELTIFIAGKMGRLEQFEGYCDSAGNITEKIVLNINICFFGRKSKGRGSGGVCSVGREPPKVIAEVGCDTTRRCSTAGSAGCCGQI